MRGKVVREVNIGRITGLSSYELAVLYGYTGTEEEYVEKEATAITNIIQYGEQLKGELEEYNKLANKLVHRMNDLGVIDSIDNIYETYSNMEIYHKTNTGDFSYTCISDGSMCIGYENQTEGIQLKMNPLLGTHQRVKHNSVWGDWLCNVSSNPVILGGE